MSIQVDAVPGRVFETLREESGETKDLALTNPNRVKDTLVSLVHLDARHFVGTFLQLAFEVLRESREITMSRNCHTLAFGL